MSRPKRRNPDEPFAIDPIDFQILKLLVEDARIPYIEIARKCKLASATVHQRIKKLKDNKIFNGVRALINPEALNLDVCAFVSIKITQPNMMDDVIGTLKKMPEVVECHCVMGEFTLMAKIYCHNNAHLMELVINNILKISGVADTSSLISLKQLIDHPVPVFDDDK
jgi:Lrp/AsnC family transcriptional regulator for asnA, asnC and gidA